MIALSIVIPTCNRRTTLLRCLEALEQQTLDRTQYEIIVVDDGSTDGTEAALRERPGTRYFLQPRNAGPAAARNVGIRAAQGAIVLLMGDDILAPPDLLEQHLTEHAHQAANNVAILGYAPWLESEPVTPLMRYLFKGPCAFRQFRYEAIQDSEEVPFGFFYTCNLSLHRDFLLSNGLFDEDFHFAYGEDTELGYRLQQRGLRLIYRRHIVAYHDHPTSYRSVRNRARNAGQVDALMARKHPLLVPIVPESPTWRKRLTRRIRQWQMRLILDPALNLADRRHWDHPRLAHAYGQALRSHQWWSLLDTLAAETSDHTATGRAARQASSH